MKLHSVLLATSWCVTTVAFSLLPLSTIAQTPPRPKPATADEAQVVAQLLKNRDRFNVCVDTINLQTAQRASRAYKVDNQTYFVMVQCFLAAYQGNYEFFLYSPKASSNVTKPLTVTQFTQNQSGQVEKVESTNVGGLPTFDQQQRILNLRTKFRGAGDCGSIARYRLDRDALKLLDFRAKFACDGKTTPYTRIFP